MADQKYVDVVAAAWMNAVDAAYKKTDSWYKDNLNITIEQLPEKTQKDIHKMIFDEINFKFFEALETNSLTQSIDDAATNVSAQFWDIASHAADQRKALMGDLDVTLYAVTYEETFARTVLVAARSEEEARVATYEAAYEGRLTLGPEDYLENSSEVTFIDEASQYDIETCEPLMTKTLPKQPSLEAKREQAAAVNAARGEAGGRDGKDEPEI